MNVNFVWKGLFYEMWKMRKKQLELDDLLNELHAKCQESSHPHLVTYHTTYI